MSENASSSGFAEFDRLTELFLRTRAVLERAIRLGELPEEATSFLADQVLPHVEAVEAGFRSRLRASEADLAELRALIRGAAIMPPEGQDRASRRAALGEVAVEAWLGRRPAALARAPASELAAIDHARLVFALMPRLPASEIHWPLHSAWPPGRRSYADIDPPRRPAELAERIEELERELWWTAAGRPSPPVAPAARRTFGFFDTAAWLGSGLFGNPA